MQLPTGLVHVLLENGFFFFPPPPSLEMVFGKRVGRRAVGVAVLGAEGDDRSWPSFTVWILNFNKSCNKGSGSLCLEASWELIFFPLCDLEIIADEIVLQLARDL